MLQKSKQRSKNTNPAKITEFSSCIKVRLKSKLCLQRKVIKLLHYEARYNVKKSSILETRSIDWDILKSYLLEL